MIEAMTYEKNKLLRTGAYMAVAGMKGDKYDFPRYYSDKIDFIIDTVCDWFGKTRKELQSKSRHREVCEPRHICMLLLKENTSLSLHEIGMKFGGRDHTTAINAINVVRSHMKTEERLRTIVDSLRTKIQ